MVPLIVMIGLESAWAAYACRMDGEVRDRCCCPAVPRAEATGADGPAIDARCCCDVTIHDASDAPSALSERTTARPPLPHLALALPPLVVAATVHVTQIASVHRLARPPPRVALYLDKHALLR